MHIVEFNGALARPLQFHELNPRPRRRDLMEIIAVKHWRNPNVVSFSEALPDLTSGKRTPREFLERCLEVIAAREKSVRAFVTLNAAGARKAADAATKRFKAGRPLSPVDGMPVAVKDIIATADMPTQMNCPAFKGWQSGQDAACVAALRQGGAILIGKTVTTEFAIGYSGPTINPFDPARTPGGSSSGSAAAVGAGMVPAGLGTQTQASTLRPASYCGAVGFKPTIGTLHTAGIHPLSATCDHLGLIAGTLDDAWRVASHISLAIGSPGNPFLTGAGALPPLPRKPKKLIRLYTRGWTEIDSDTEDAFNETIAALQFAGVRIASRDNDPQVARLEAALDAGVDGAIAIVAYEMKWPYEDYIARFGKIIGKRIHGLIEQARGMSPEDYEKLLENRRRVRHLVHETAGGADGYITLAASGPAILGHEYTGSRTFLVYGSWLGLPAFSLPLLQVNGLPLGIQLIGEPGGDGKLCAVANWFMQKLR
jgi:Asp-tRNA(Asn)/Glu-tRNA(Gln) amidotransferase A subunit family amidase